MDLDGLACWALGPLARCDEPLVTWVEELTCPDDYVFASAEGWIRWPESFLTDHIKPAAKRAGIGDVGWHTFRHTYASLLAELDTKPAVQKELLRHANISTTMNVYTQAVEKSLRKAARKAVKALL